MGKRRTLIISIIIFFIVAGVALNLILNKGYFNGKSLVAYEKVHEVTMSVNKENLSVIDKEEAEITVLLDGEEMKEGYEIEISDNDVLSLKDNKIIAKNIGTTTITVKAKEYDFISTAEIVVYKPIKSMKRTANPGAIRLGSDRQLTLTTTPSDATRTGLKFESSDESIATVNNNGIISSKGRGTVTITVTDKFTGETTSIKQTVQ